MSRTGKRLYNQFWPRNCQLRRATVRRNRANKWRIKLEQFSYSASVHSSSESVVSCFLLGWTSYSARCRVGWSRTVDVSSITTYSIVRNSNSSVWVRLVPAKSWYDETGEDRAVLGMEGTKSEFKWGDRAGSYVGLNWEAWERKTYTFHWRMDGMQS